MRAVILLTLASCAAALPVEADSAYLAEQLACVDKAETKDQATACRNEVKARWGAKDPGAR